MASIFSGSNLAFEAEKAQARDCCLDCRFCRVETLHRGKARFFCARFGRPLGSKRVWERPCKRFELY